jgi:hypothetical protein
MLVGFFNPTRVYGAEEQITAQMSEQLQNSIDNQRYPNGVFDFLTARVEAKEGQTSIEYNIVRRGNIDAPASVRLKSVDISAKYQQDYTFALISTWNRDSLEKSEKQVQANTSELVAPKSVLELNADEQNNTPQTVGEIKSEVSQSQTQENTSVDTSANNHKNANMDNAGTLAGISAVQTGAYYESNNWKDADLEHKQQLAQAYKKSYENTPGAFLDLKFEPGDFAKSIQINIVQDNISEDDEQALFVLINPKGADVTENPTGYLNIKDDDEIQEDNKTTFDFEAPSVEVDRNSGIARIAVVRHQNLERYQTAIVSSSSDSASAGINYKQFQQTVQFIPMQTRSVLEIPILTRAENTWLRFFAHIDGTEKQAEILLEPVDSNTNPKESGISPLAQMSTSADNSAVAWTWLESGSKSLNVGESVSKTNLDLSMISKITMNMANNSPGTYYQYKSGKKTNSGYYSNFRNFVDFGSIRSYDNKIYNTSISWEHYLTDEEKKQKSITVGVRSADASTKNSNGSFQNVTAYYMPIQLQLLTPEMTDADAVITPREYTSASDYTSKGQSYSIGTLDFQDGSQTDAQVDGARFKNFYNNDIVNLKAQYLSGLPDDVKNGVYLWGFKLKSRKADAKNKYYYVDKTSFSISDLYTGRLKDWKGNTISQDEVMTNVDGKTPIYQILPVFKQKPAIVTLTVNNDKTTYSPGTFNNATTGISNNTVSMGMLDTLAISSFSKDGEYIKSYDYYTANAGLKPENTSDDYRQLYSNIYQTQDSKNANISTTEAYILANTPMNPDSSMKNSWTISSVGGNISDAGVYKFSPVASGKSYNHLVAQYGIGSISVAVHPRATDIESLKKTTTIYTDESGKSQTSEYTHEEYIGGFPYSRSSTIKITPYTLQRAYKILSTLRNQADEKEYITRWYDATGDANNDGVLDANELANLPNGAPDTANPKLMMPVAGNLFSFVPSFQSNERKIYYTTTHRSQNPLGKQQVISGRIARSEISILDKNNTAVKPVVTPVEGVVVEIQGQQCITNKDGEFQFTSADYDPSDAYIASFTYNGQVYTTTLQVNIAAEINLNEYDYFDIKNFTAYRHDDNNRLQKLDPKTEITNEDAKHLYSFEITPKVNNLFVKNVAIRRYSKDNTLKSEYSAVYDTSSKAYRIVSDASSKNGNYSMNPSTEDIVAGDYLTVQVIDTNDHVYEEHKIGFTYSNAVNAIAIINTFAAPASKVVDLIGSVDTAFDLGLVKNMDAKLISLMKSNGQIIDEAKTLVDSSGDVMLDENGNPRQIKQRTIKLGYSKTFEGSGDDSGRPEKTPGETITEKAKEMDSQANSGNNDQAAKTTEEEAKQAVDKTSEEGKRNAKVTRNSTATMSIGVSLEMKEDPVTKRYYFSNFALIGSLQGALSQKVEYMTPIGITLYLQLNLSGNADALIAVEPYNNKRTYIGGSGTDTQDTSINFSKIGRTDLNRDFDIYGRLFVKPTINITLGAKASFLADVSVSGAAKFDLTFSTGDWGNGNVNLSAEVKLELLGGLIEKTWNIANKSYDMFSYGPESLATGAYINSVKDELYPNEDFRYQKISAHDFGDRAYLDNRKSVFLASDQSEEDEHELVRATIPAANPHISNISTPDETGAIKYQLLTYLEDDGSADELNHTHLMYRILTREGENTTSSEPQFVDTDNTTADDSPYMLDVGNKIAVIWNTPDAPFSPDDRITAMFESRSIKMRFFDKSNMQFGELINVTNQETSDIFPEKYSNEHQNIFTWNSSGDSFSEPDELVISYLKSDYTSAKDSGEEEYIGDIINPTTRLAYRRYNLKTNNFILFSDEDKHIINSNLEKMCSDKEEPQQVETCKEEVESAYLGRFNGEWILDSQFYTYNSSNDANAQIGEKSTDNSRILEQTSVGLTEGGTNFLVFFELVDMDGDTKATPDDTTVMAVVVDTTNHKIYEPTLVLSSSNIRNMNIESGSNQKTGDTELFLITDGDIKSYDVRQLVDERSIKSSSEGENYSKIVVNEKSDKYSGFKTIYSAPENCPVSAISLSSDRENVYLIWSENKITYRDGIPSTSNEAKLPENYFAERQLNMMEYKKTEFSSTITDENGEMMKYPEKVDDEIVDYNTVPDINGLKGVVHAGDYVVKNSSTYKWTNPVQLTNGQGDNYSSAQISRPLNGIIQILALKGKSQVQDVNGTAISAEDINNRSLILKDYNVLDGNYSLHFNSELLDKIKSGEENKTATVKVKNETLLDRDNVKVKFVQGDKVVDEKTILKLEGGQSMDMTFDLQPVQNLNGLKIQAIIESGDKKWTTDYTFKILPLLEFRDVKYDMLERNQVRIQASLKNLGSTAIDDAQIRVFDSSKDQIAASLPNKLLADQIATISVDADIPESLYTEKQSENGKYSQIAQLTLQANGGANAEILLERSATSSYVEQSKTVNLQDSQVAVAGSQMPITTLELSDKIKLEPLAENTQSHTLTINPLAQGSENSKLDLRLVSSDNAVVEVRNGVLVPKANGDAVIKALVFASGTRLVSSVAEDGEATLIAEDIFKTLPTSLIKQIDIPVHISGQIADAGGKSNLNPSELAKTGLWIILLFIILVFCILVMRSIREKNRA